jgi:hypothetical protein
MYKPKNLYPIKIANFRYLSNHTCKQLVSYNKMFVMKSTTTHSLIHVNHVKTQKYTPHYNN